jgi:hypothetical protein
MARTGTGAFLIRRRLSDDSDASAARSRSHFFPLQLGGWGLLGAEMFVAGASQWTIAYAAAVKSSLTVSGFGASLLLRAVYRAAFWRGF